MMSRYPELYRKINIINDMGKSERNYRTQTHISHVLTVDRRHVADNSKKLPCEANKRHWLRLRGLLKTANSFLLLPLSKMEEGFNSHSKTTRRYYLLCIIQHSKMFTRQCRGCNEPFHIFTPDPMPTCDAHRLLASCCFCFKIFYCRTRLAENCKFVYISFGFLSNPIYESFHLNRRPSGK